MATISRAPRDDYGFGQDFDPAQSTRPAGAGAGQLPTAGAGATPFQLYSPPTPQVPGAITQQARDMFGNPVVPVAPAYVGDTGYAPAGYGANIGQYQPPAAPAVSTTPAPDTPATPEAFAGSPLNTLYGIDSESNLTEDQKKLARMIQGKYDASLNRRDRELAQYGAPRLASFTEDEALARAMSLARGLNIPVQDALGLVQGSGSPSRGGSTGGGGGVGGGGAARSPTTTTTRPVTQAATKPLAVAKATTPPGASPSQAAKWQQILSGLTSIVPLLLGKDGMATLMDKGLPALWNKIFPGASPAAYKAMVAPQLQRLTMTDTVLGGGDPQSSFVGPWDTEPVAAGPWDVDPVAQGPWDVEPVAQGPWDVDPEFVGPPALEPWALDPWADPTFGIDPGMWADPSAWWAPEFMDVPSWDMLTPTDFMF